MAQVEKFLASIQVGDSAGKFASFSTRVSASSARAYIAAADAAARAATVVGIMLRDAEDLMQVDLASTWKKYSVQADFVNDAFAFPSPGDARYNSNKWKITYSTTNNGLPVVESVYMPLRTQSLPMESNGVNLDLTTPSVSNFIAAFKLPGLSSFGTPILNVLEITLNDE